VAFLGLTIVGAAFGAWQGYQQFYARVKHNALYGLYDVESCRLGGRKLTLATDSTRWRKVDLNRPIMNWGRPFDKALKIR